MRVLFTTNYGEEKFNKLRELGYEVFYYPENRIENNEEVNSVDVLVTYDPFKRLDISQMENLKYIQLTSIGVDQLPKEEIAKRNIKIANNKGGYSIPIGEWIVLYILQIYKNSKKLFKQQQDKTWKMDMSIDEIYGKKIGFIGTGTIALEAAKRLKTFGVEMWGLNTEGTNKKYLDKCFSRDEIDEVLKNCDVIVCTMPATSETIGMMNKDKFDLMKENSVFINVGRGNVVNEQDLIDSISKFRGVALDVFENEPLDKENKLWEFENVIITPHNSWASSRNDERTFNTVYNNLKHYLLDNKPLDNIVDISKGY